MSCRLVIFDFDGTLADSVPWFIGVFNEVADRFRIRRVEDHEVDSLRGLGGRELMRRLEISPWKLPWLSRHLRKMASRDLHLIALFDGVDELLMELASQGATLAVVSSNSLGNVRTVLGPRNVARISHFECGVSMFGKKASFRRILRNSGVPGAESLCVGDEIRDLEAARAAGIPFGAVAWGYTTPEALRRRKPDALFHQLDEIGAFVRSR